MLTVYSVDYMCYGITVYISIIIIIKDIPYLNSAVIQCKHLSIDHVTSELHHSLVSINSISFHIIDGNSQSSVIISLITMTSFHLH